MLLTLDVFLDVVPLLDYFIRSVLLGIPKYMRMPADKFGADMPQRICGLETPFLFLHIGDHGRHKQQIPRLYKLLSTLNGNSLKYRTRYLKKGKKVLLCSEIEQFPGRQEIEPRIASFGGILRLNIKS